ncbi:hypothetical protein Fmac_010021 [Flemingia macrophylla]|uniref:Uncharacterized protein n=1 Tax=Flemingia macrophylla TaxID=520843 RepID=A0ABD1N1W5_9FABA
MVTPRRRSEHSGKTPREIPAPIQMRIEGVAESDKNECFLHPTAPSSVFSKPLSAPPTNPSPPSASALQLLPGGTPQQQQQQPTNHRIPHRIPITNRQHRGFLQRPPLPPTKNEAFPSQPRHKPNQKPTRRNPIRFSLRRVRLHPPIQRL